MRIYKYIVFAVLLTGFSAFSQIDETNKFQVKGKVESKERGAAISGVQVSATSGSSTYTNAFGVYRIMVVVGDNLEFQSLEFETVTYRIINNEDVDVLVEGYDADLKKSASYATKRIIHKAFLDSANQFKKKNIGKSLDYIRKSLEQLGKRGNSKERSASFSLLGEIYEYHKQYDLAIDNYKLALDTSKSIKTKILLGNVFVLNKNFEAAKNIFDDVLSKKTTRYQKIQAYEGLGDAYKGLQNINRAVANYNDGLQIAKKKLIAPKITELNAKIAESYADDNQSAEAEEYFMNSLESAKKETPQKSLEIKDRTADFYNKNNLYDKEIALREKSLEELNSIENDETKGARAKSITKKAESRAPVTSQRINYKIANTLIIQDKLEEAIPYLEKSIVAAADANDLVVQKDATRKLSEVYSNKGDKEKALETYRKYATIVDTLYVRKEQEISRAERLSRQIAAKQNRITGLEKDKELSESKYSLAKTKQDLYTTTTKKQELLIYALIFGVLLFGLATFFFYRSNKQQKLANNLLALKSLRSQMNPHFIFNALNSVNNYISKNDERSANRFLSEFSTLMRAVLENSEEDFIPLSKELDLLALYVKLEHSRFSDKFKYSINIDENIAVDSFKIPPMLLQPYIENAIWHGLRYKEEQGFLNINLKQKGSEAIEITIEDNGIGRAKSAELKTQNQKKQRSKGMGNIKERVKILNEMYKDKVAVSIQDLYDDKTGTKVILTLKKD